MSAETPGQAPGIEVTHDPEIPVRFVQLWLCDLCLDGDGEQCHTPDCSLWLNRPPDMPIRNGAAVTVLDAAPDQQIIFDGLAHGIVKPTIAHFVAH